MWIRARSQGRDRGGPASVAAVLVVAGLAVAPFLGLVVQAFADRWYGTSLVPQAFGTRGVGAVVADPAIREAVTNSLVVAAAVAVVAVVLAWPAARHLATGGSTAAWAMMAAPVLMPPLVLGDGLASWFVRFGLTDQLVAIGLAHLAVCVPYAVLGLVPAFGQELEELDHSAALLGAGPVRRTIDVVVPAAGRHLALAVALAFTVSWSQYGTSLAVGGGTPMLPLVLVPFVRSDPQIAAALDLVFLFPPVVTLGLAAHSARRPRSGPDAVERVGSGR